jgi:hypothetical protein
MVKCGPSRHCRRDVGVENDRKAGWRAKRSGWNQKLGDCRGKSQVHCRVHNSKERRESARAITPTVQVMAGGDCHNGLGG